MKPINYQVNGDINFLIDLSLVEIQFSQQIYTLFIINRQYPDDSSIDEITGDLFHIALQYIETAFILNVSPIFVDQQNQFRVNHDAQEKVHEIYHQDIMEYLIESDYINNLRQSNDFVSINSWIAMVIHLLFQILLVVYNHLTGIIHEYQDQYVLVGKSMLPFYQQIRSISVHRLPEQNISDALVEVYFHYW